MSKQWPHRPVTAATKGAISSSRHTETSGNDVEAWKPFDRRTQPVHSTKSARSTASG